VTLRHISSPIIKIESPSRALLTFWGSGSKIEKTCGRRSFQGNEMTVGLLSCLYSKPILKISQADVPKGSEAWCSSGPFSLHLTPPSYFLPLGGISSFEANSYSGVVSPRWQQKDLSPGMRNNICRSFEQ